MTNNSVYSVRPAGQPEGYDYYVPIDGEKSRLLEKADYKVRMAVMNVAAAIANVVNFSSSTYERHYNRLIECEKDYDDRKAEISNTIIIPFIDSIHGENSNVSVKWSHMFKTPFVDVKYLYDIKDHSVEKDLVVGTYSTAEIGIDDACVEKLETLAAHTTADQEIFEFILRNYPDPDERQQVKIDEFVERKEDSMFEYDSLKTEVTNIVNMYLENNSITNAPTLQWNLDFATKKITITKSL